MQDVKHQMFTDSVESEVMLSMNEEDKDRHGCRRKAHALRRAYIRS